MTGQHPVSATAPNGEWYHLRSFEEMLVEVAGFYGWPSLQIWTTVNNEYCTYHVWMLCTFGGDFQLLGYQHINNHKYRYWSIAISWHDHGVTQGCSNTHTHRSTTLHFRISGSHLYPSHANGSERPGRYVRLQQKLGSWILNAVYREYNECVSYLPNLFWDAPRLG